MIATTVIFAVLPACARDRQSPPPYTNPTGSEFPILAYHAFRIPEMITPENFKIVRDCGINMVCAWCPDTANLTKTLNCTQEFNIKVLASSPFTSNVTGLKQNVRKYDKYPMTAGYVLWDEPDADLFPKLGQLIEAAIAPDETKLGYVNLFPNYANAKQLGKPSYKAYLEAFIETANPQFLSYDNYCIIQKGNNLILRDNYFENLEIARDVAENANIPLWTFCLSTAHFDYPIPDKAQLRFQAFSGLAYGAQAIQYYGYGPCEIAGKKILTTPVNQQGIRNRAWYAMRDVNREIQALAPVFLGAKVENVWHTGNNIPKGTTRLSAGKLPRELSSVVSTGQGVVVSHLTNNGHDYILIVNRDFQNRQTVRVAKNANVKRINAKGRTYTDKASRVTLPAGGWCLYTW